MSFRLFVYYCFIVGAWCGFFGWVLGKLIAPPIGENPGFGGFILSTCILGGFLGFSVAFGLSFLDAVFNLSLSKFGQVAMRVMAGTFLGIFAGLIGAAIGGSLFYLLQNIAFVSGLTFLVGWTIVGFLVGISICFFELAVSFTTRKDIGWAMKKVAKCLTGGTIGGVLGGSIAFVLRFLAEKIFVDKDPNQLWSPTAIGFIAIGACIGLLIAMAQVLLKEAWVKVEAGFRPGREMLLAKEKTSIGRAEGMDIALFGDSGVEKAHANIVLDAGRYFIEDLQSPGGTYVNDQKVAGRAPLKTGDLIRMGKSLIRFNERAKRKD